MLGSPSAWALSYLAVKLFSKYSNLCENHTLTSQMDRRTDRQTTYCSITALCIASSGNYTEGRIPCRPSEPHKEHIRPYRYKPKLQYSDLWWICCTQQIVRCTLMCSDVFIGATTLWDPWDASPQNWEPWDQYHVVPPTFMTGCNFFRCNCKRFVIVIYI